MKTNRFLSAAIFVLAITFTFSCSSDDGGSDGDGSSSSVAKGKSSSSKLGQSSSDGTSISSSGDKGASSSSVGSGYKTVKIGNQTWMAENLNIATGGKCYDGKSANCNKYGRLYDWKTAKSVCPSGWHLPTNEEWEILISSLGGEEEAGTKLKSANGFAALPSGFGDSDGDFSDAEEYGYWWSATDEGDEDYAWHWKIDYEYEEVSSDYDDKTKLYSVRCVQNTQNVRYSSSVGKSSSSSGSASSSSIAGGGSSSSLKGNSSSSVSGGSCDISGHETVEIGNQTWMAENLNCDVAGSKCYDNDPANCDKYGRLYDWATAMALPASCNSSSCASQIKAKHRGICPSGWHIPSNDDWNVLIKFISPNCSDTDFCAGGIKLKAKEGWNDYYGRSGNGTDDFGFSALPGGSGNSGGFSDVGKYVDWWSANESNSRNAYDRYLYYDSEILIGRNYSKVNLFSVRCVQD